MKHLPILLPLTLILLSLSLCACQGPGTIPTPAVSSSEAAPTTLVPTPAPSSETAPAETEPASTSSPVTEPAEPIDPDTLFFTSETYPKVDGSTSTKPLAKILQEEFTGAENVEISHSKSHQSYLNLINGKCDMLLAVEPSQDEYAYAAKMGVTLHTEKVTGEGFVFFVNKRNPVDSLTLQQIRDIYSGKIRNWKEVGGPDAEIVAFQRPSDSGSQTGMENHVMGGTKMMAPVSGTVADTMNEIVDVISAFDSGEFAIGYSYYYYANTMYLGENVKLIAVEGVKPNNTTIREGDYPLLTGYYAITREGDTTKETDALIQGILSGRGQRAVQRAGYVPVIDVGSTDPEDPEISDERSLSLSDTYTLNPVRVTTASDVYHSYRYNYAVLSGLDDAAVQSKINDLLHDKAEAAVIKGVSQGGRRTRIAFSTVRTEANFANVLSVVFSEDIVTMDARYESVTAVNVRLDTGEELHFHDLFKKGTKGKDVFNADFYSEVVFRSAIRTSGSMDITPAVAHYNGAEDRILSLIQDFDAGKDFDFYFTPREVVLLDQLEPDLGYRDLTVWFTHCMEKVAIYHKYETPEPAYDASYPASGGIPALTDRSDPYLSTVDESDGYLLDAALYVRGDNGPADLPDACKDRVLALYTAYVQECREKIRKDAEAGVFSFHNISATAQYDPLESAGDEPNYWLKVSDRFLTWDSKEEFREASRKMLKSIRSPHLDNITGINNYLRYALTDPDQSYTDRSSLWVFDADGNIVETKETGH